MTVVFTAARSPRRHQGRQPGPGPGAFAFTVVMLSGVVSKILSASSRLGPLHHPVLPYTVISGFMSGMARILIVPADRDPWLGQAQPTGVWIGTLQSLPSLLQGANRWNRCWP